MKKEDFFSFFIYFIYELILSGFGFFAFIFRSISAKKKVFRFYSSLILHPSSLCQQSRQFAHSLDSGEILAL
jgi:hypothetical protein